MQGKNLSFVLIEKNNPEHLYILNKIAKETIYLGNLPFYSFDHPSDTITGNCYFAIFQQNIIGFVGLSEEIATSIGNTVSIYYAVCKEFYGHGFGQLILNEISNILKQHTSVNIIIANVEKANQFGMRTIERAKFIKIPELCDDEENQYHRHL